MSEIDQEQMISGILSDLDANTANTESAQTETAGTEVVEPVKTSEPKTEVPKAPELTVSQKEVLKYYKMGEVYEKLPDENKGDFLAQMVNRRREEDRKHTAEGQKKAREQKPAPVEDLLDEDLTKALSERDAYWENRLNELEEQMTGFMESLKTQQVTSEADAVFASLDRSSFPMFGAGPSALHLQGSPESDSRQEVLSMAKALQSVRPDLSLKDAMQGALQAMYPAQYTKFMTEKAIASRVKQNRSSVEIPSAVKTVGHEVDFSEIIEMASQI